MDTSKQLLLKIFDITEGDDQKDIMMEMFGGMLLQDTIYNLINSLSHHKKRKLKDKWEVNEENPAAMIGMMNKLFSKQQIDEMFERTASQAIEDYLLSIEPRLNHKQKDELFKLSEELEPSGIRKAIKEHAAYRRNLNN